MNHIEQVLLFLCAPIITSFAQSSEKHPIILVPGDGGSQIYCQETIGNKSNSYLIWVSLWHLTISSAVLEQLRLKYDPATGRTSDIGPCKIIIPGWGQTWSIENLDTWGLSVTSYFEYIVAALRRDPFYVSGVTLRGAPFDFRRSPDDNIDFVTKMTNLIEETYQNAGGRRVVLLGHSLGSLYCLSFLKAKPDWWKKQFVKSFLSVSGPLAGAVKALRVEASGDNFGIPLRSSRSFRHIQRSMTSLALMLPDPRLWSASEPLILTPKRNYSAHDYEQFFKDINFPLGYQMMLQVRRHFDGLIGPTGVDEVYCIYGTMLKTTQQMIYKPATFYRSPFPDQTPELVTGEGDQTVSARSLEVCRSWPGATTVEMPGAEHVNIVGESRMIDLLCRVAGVEVP